MKKILFLTVRDPFSGRFSGDVIRSKKFVEYFAKKNNVQVLALGKNNSLKNSKRLSVRLFKNENFFIILFRCLISLLRSKPLHLNFFYSSALKRYLKLNIKSYDLIFCQSIRSFQYLPEIKKNHYCGCQKRIYACCNFQSISIYAASKKRTTPCQSKERWDHPERKKN